MEKVALVSGGLKGIGKSICSELVANGYKVISLSRSGHLKDQHVVCDVSSEESVKEAFQQISESVKHIDVLVNAAGINRDALLLAAKHEDIMAQVSTNLVGSMLVCKHALRLMLPRKQGCIINIGSIVGSHGNAGQCAYAASKAGLVGFTKSLAKELAPRNIQANLIAPGFIESDMTARLPQAKVTKLQRAIPLGEFGQPSHVAQLALYLTQAPYVTGQTIYCDGGLHLNL